jgi:dihydrofolate reductase
MKISIIVAIAENGIIGSNNKLIWRLSDDLKNFKRITYGHFIIMGRKTFESIGRPLAGRTNIILSKNRNFSAEGCMIFSSVEEALKYSISKDQEEIFIIGGAQIYKEILPIADKLYLTKVHASPPGDAYFPTIDFSEWKEIVHTIVQKNEKNDFDFEFIELIRRKSKK